nr:Chain PA, VAL-TYR-GLU-LYS-LYS-PRO [synthetic construct]7QNS_PB Chain PB, VAL-TYR-GLU-LYS-LYS-PRO [synthetic construct]7QNS_PC Chain PC, VAL-TYR-GLU-LYS-LYS-PRO [synthetic construct]
VYEKKP